MLQEHSFFARPLIYFGSHPDLQEESDAEEDAFSDPWPIFFDAHLPLHPQIHIGLFLQWSDVSE